MVYYQHDQMVLKGMITCTRNMTLMRSAKVPPTQSPHVLTQGPDGCLGERQGCVPETEAGSSRNESCEDFQGSLEMVDAEEHPDGDTRD